MTSAIFFSFLTAYKGFAEGKNESKHRAGWERRIRAVPESAASTLHCETHRNTQHLSSREQCLIWHTNICIYTVSPKRRESGWLCHEIKEHTNWRWSRVMWNVEDPKTSPNVPKMEGVQLNPHYRSGAKWSATWQGRAAMDSPPQFS